MKVSFDFDGTLDRDVVQQYAKELVGRGHEVWITTARFEKIEDYDAKFMKKHGIYNLNEQHRYLFEVALACGIEDDHIHFCNMADKWEWIKDKDFLWHLDDDWEELKGINVMTDAVGVSVFGNSTWKNKCEKLLNE